MFVYAKAEMGQIQSVLQFPRSRTGPCTPARRSHHETDPFSQLVLLVTCHVDMSSCFLISLVLAQQRQFRVQLLWITITLRLRWGLLWGRIAVECRANTTSQRRHDDVTVSQLVHKEGGLRSKA